jgi:hypothetical protein
MVAFIDEPRDASGVEPIGRVLPIAPSTYHAHVARRTHPETLSRRVKRDTALKGLVRLWATDAARCTLEDITPRHRPLSPCLERFGIRKWEHVDRLRRPAPPGKAVKCDKPPVDILVKLSLLAMDCSDSSARWKAMTCLHATPSFIVHLDHSGQSSSHPPTVYELSAFGSFSCIPRHSSTSGHSQSTL